MQVSFTHPRAGDGYRACVHARARFADVHVCVSGLPLHVRAGGSHRASGGVRVRPACGYGNGRVLRSPAVRRLPPSIQRRGRIAWLMDHGK